jgi:O-antigen ligase
VLVSIFVAASRSGVVAALAALAILAWAWWARSRIPAALITAVFVASSVLAGVGGAEVFEKQAESVQAGHLLNYREQAWNAALSMCEHYPWFGVGMDNFRLGTAEMESQRFRDLMPHAHNLYLNTLAERGIVGALPVFALLALWAWCLVTRRPRTTDPDHEWLLWGGAASAWIVTIAVGMVNTSFHHEHGLLAVLLLGLWLPVSHRR